MSPRLPGIHHERAVRAFQRAGFSIKREGRKHVIMTDGVRTLVVPRNNPIKPSTMGGVIEDAGLTIEAFKKLL